MSKIAYGLLMVMVTMVLFSGKTVSAEEKVGNRSQSTMEIIEKY